MGKRMTATEKWDKEWFMNLIPKHKCLWMYINDKCDQAGMWEVNYRLASMHIGEPVTEKDIDLLGSRIEKFAPGKIWIVDHVSFQCGTLSDKSPAHKPIFNLLKKYSLLDRVLSRVSNTLQEIEIENGKGNGQGNREGKGTSKLEIFECIFNDERFLTDLSVTHKGKDVNVAFEQCWVHFSQQPNPPEFSWQWKQKLNTWLTNMNGNGKGSKQTIDKGTDHLGGLMEGFKRRHGGTS